MMHDYMLYFAASCAKKGIPLLPTWYQYIDGSNDATGKCNLNFTFPDDLAAIGLAVVEILLRIGVLVAVGYVIYGGFMYITSQGEPDKSTAARHTIINALIGLAVGIIATGVVAFIGRRLI